jgi:hypothetical protein
VHPPILSGIVADQQVQGRFILFDLGEAAHWLVETVVGLVVGEVPTKPVLYDLGRLIPLVDPLCGRPIGKKAAGRIFAL